MSSRSRTPRRRAVVTTDEEAIKSETKTRNWKAGAMRIYLKRAQACTEAATTGIATEASDFKSKEVKRIRLADHLPTPVRAARIQEDKEDVEARWDATWHHSLLGRILDVEHRLQAVEKKGWRPVEIDYNSLKFELGSRDVLVRPSVALAPTASVLEACDHDHMQGPERTEEEDEWEMTRLKSILAGEGLNAAASASEDGAHRAKLREELEENFIGPIGVIDLLEADTASEPKLPASMAASENAEAEVLAGPMLDPHTLAGPEAESAPGLRPDDDADPISILFQLLRHGLEDYYWRDQGGQMDAQLLVEKILKGHGVPYDDERAYNILRDIEIIPGDEGLLEELIAECQGDETQAEAKLRAEFDAQLTCLIDLARDTPMWPDEEDALDASGA